MQSLPDGPAVAVPAATCDSCGGAVRNGDTCAERFAELLALDHSRREPWGSRHGVAFAVYTLQHSANVQAPMLEQCWTMLQRVYVSGDDRADVVKGMRAQYRSKRERNWSRKNSRHGDRWDGVQRGDIPAPHNFDVTIQDLGSFPEHSYAEQLDAWCLATLDAWNRNTMSV